MHDREFIGVSVYVMGIAYYEFMMAVGVEQQLAPRGLEADVRASQFDVLLSLGRKLISIILSHTKSVGRYF